MALLSVSLYRLSSSVLMVVKRLVKILLMFLSTLCNATSTPWRDVWSRKPCRPRISERWKHNTESDTHNCWCATVCKDITAASCKVKKRSWPISSQRQTLEPKLINTVFTCQSDACVASVICASTTPRVLPLLKTYASTAKVYKIRRAISAQHTAGISAASSNAVSQISFTRMTHWWCICSSNFSRKRKGNDYLNQHFFYRQKKQTETSWLQPWADQEEITAWTRLFKHLKQLYNSICLLKKVGIIMQKEGCREGVRMHGKQRSLGHKLCHHWGSELVGITF